MANRSSLTSRVNNTGPCISSVPRVHSYQLNGAHHSGYVLVAVTADNYRLGQVAEVGQAAPASPASSLSPLWYIPIAAVAVILAVVLAVLLRRRRAAAAPS